MNRERIKIEGMSCGHCVEAVRKALDGLGVDIHNVEIGRAEISYGPSVDRQRIDDAIEDAGYTPTGHEVLA